MLQVARQLSKQLFLLTLQEPWCPTPTNYNRECVSSRPLCSRYSAGEYTLAFYCVVHLLTSIVRAEASNLVRPPSFIFVHIFI